MSKKDKLKNKHLQEELKLQNSKKRHVKYGLIIAGVDPTSGAGIFADNAVFRYYKIWPLNIITLTAVQNSIHGVTRVIPTPLDVLEDQFHMLFEEFPHPETIKIGMLHSVEQIQLVTRMLDKYLLERKTNVVIDPVLVCKNNFIHQDMENIVDAYINDLLPQATFIVPNLKELMLLTNKIYLQINDQKLDIHNHKKVNLDVLQKMCLIVSSYAKINRVLCKYKNLCFDDDSSIEVKKEIGEVFFSDCEFYKFCHEYHKKTYHGSGCNLSSILACELTKRKNDLQSVEKTLQTLQNHLIRTLIVYKNYSTLTFDFNDEITYHSE